MFILSGMQTVQIILLSMRRVHIVDSNWAWPVLSIDPAGEGRQSPAALASRSPPASTMPPHQLWVLHYEREDNEPCISQIARMRRPHFPVHLIPPARHFCPERLPACSSPGISDHGITSGLRLPQNKEKAPQKRGFFCSARAPVEPYRASKRRGGD